MKKHSKPRRTYGLNLVEKAVIANEWRHTAVEAQLAAMCSLNSSKVVEKAGRMLFVVLGACAAKGMHEDDPRIRILRGAANAVHEQAGESEIPVMRRQSIVIGLQTARALMHELDRKALVDSACDLTVKLRNGDVWASDFEAIFSK